MSDWEDDIEAQLATSARARIAATELEELRKDYNELLLDRSQVLAGCDRLGKDLAAAIVANGLLRRENERLRAELAGFGYAL